MSRLLSMLIACAIMTRVLAENGPTGINLNNMETMFNFGDSYSTTGYVLRKGKVKKLKGMGETTSGGYNWVQFLAYSQPKLATSYYDFARSGATVNNSVVPSNAQSFVDQFRLWKEWFVGNESEVKWVPDSTLFTIWFGINDVGYMTELSLNGTIHEPLIFDSYAKLINELYDIGARNILFLNVPPTHKTPYVKTKSAKDIATFETLIASYNHRLFNFVTNLVKVHPQLNVALFDTQSFFTTILDSPQSYGYKQSTGFCNEYTWSSNNPNNTHTACEAPLENLVWYNSYHPSWAVHRLMALVIEEMLSPAEATPISDPFKANSFVSHHSAYWTGFRMSWGALAFFLVIAVFAAQAVNWRQCIEEFRGTKREEGYRSVDSESVGSDLA